MEANVSESVRNSGDCEANREADREAKMRFSRDA